MLKRDEFCSQAVLRSQKFHHYYSWYAFTFFLWVASSISGLKVTQRTTCALSWKRPRWNIVRHHIGFFFSLSKSKTVMLPWCFCILFMWWKNKEQKRFLSFLFEMWLYTGGGGTVMFVAFKKGQIKKKKTHKKCGCCCWSFVFFILIFCNIRSSFPRSCLRHLLSLFK